jgi:hypothetical protein
MKFYSKLFALVAIATFSNVAAFAHTRIRFAKGRTSATVTGRVATGGRVCYIAAATAGQQLTATISSRSGKVRTFESGETSYVFEVERRGDQFVCVDNLDAATTYSLTVSIK